MLSVNMGGIFSSVGRHLLSPSILSGTKTIHNSRKDNPLIIVCIKISSGLGRYQVKLSKKN